ncbi:glycerophosphodiester phosphodiesterase [Devosia nitrariae]|uniref:Glycerophosphoryl diester phosphodiesterase n=1 Tax=Devosia nitrariae TaxID=2071872 RepID=A0ABQ5WDL3_9HYPH|nr:glycerophosphodiester phosphodiesterase family protein [Devosia nitrariae]GLQ57881.1 glycerophosphoryl diester phosphodiesterase [Devosia nitrariae]
MHSDIFIDRDGHRTWFKWHRARRHGSDPVFTGRRILEGMQLGASVEVDLVVHADRGMAVLHNLTLERETTGNGRVRDTSAQTLRALNLRGNDGAPIADKVMLLEDLAALLARDGAHSDALLQLDYKEDAAALDAQTVANFAAALAPVARHFIISSGDAASVAMLSAGLPDLDIGYDPCHGGTLAELRATGNYAAFVADAIAAAPRATLIYLAYPVVLEAEEAGFDMIGAFHAHGRRVDTYTLQRADVEGIAIAERLIALKVDQITTDDPHGLGAALALRANTPAVTV